MAHAGLGRTHPIALGEDTKMNTAEDPSVREHNVRSFHPGPDICACDDDGERITNLRLCDREIIRQDQVDRAHGATASVFKGTIHGNA
jgi:hypothetical protein